MHVISMCKCDAQSHLCPEECTLDTLCLRLEPGKEPGLIGLQEQKRECQPLCRAHFGIPFLELIWVKFTAGMAVHFSTPNLSLEIHSEKNERNE